MLNFYAASTAVTIAQIDGQLGDHVLLAPPFIVEADDIKVITDKLALAINDVSNHTERAA